MKALVDADGNTLDPDYRNLKQSNPAEERKALRTVPSRPATQSQGETNVPTLPSLYGRGNGKPPSWENRASVNTPPRYANSEGNGTLARSTKPSNWGTPC